MSLPFFTRKADAQKFWGGSKNKLVKVYVSANRGFLQAPKSGYYWVTAEMKKGLNLPSSK